ncbi:hypothetical protein HPP92_009168 [Vanilla planifolia]|uniref:Uncharacterized protein n=1 Tax=Vanilla planifolia TaxID=51239 RepID=A0A835V756_VANPL|nr:hypothetical protein HPP92_009168 [Vanilla planifolia]
MIKHYESVEDSPEVHANTAEVLCAITMYAPPGFAAKICSPSQLSHGSVVIANPETVNGMLQCLGELLKLLDVTASEVVLPTTYGYLKPPLGKHRLKPTISAQGRSPPRIGNIGHLTSIANKLVQAANTSRLIQTHLQENTEWVDWHAGVLVKRNAMENIHNWACGRPTSLHDRARDSKDEESRDRDYDVAVLASNLSQEFRYSIYGNDDIEDARGSLERDDEDVYFDDESAEVVISSLRLGDDQDSSSLFTNSNWFAFEDERAVNDRSTGSLASPSPNSDDADEVVVGESEDLADKMASLQFSGSKCDDTQEMNSICLGNGPVNEPNETSGNLSPSECEKPLEWVEWRETVDLINENGANTASSAPNGDFEIEAFDSKHDNGWASDKTDNQEFNCDSPQSNDVISSASQSVSPLVVNNIPSMVPMESGHEKLVKNKDE